MGVNVLTLHVLVSFGVYYLAASICAFSVALLVGFLLQKNWTFQARSVGRAKIQFGMYAALTLVNLGINTVIVYVCVEYLHLNYLLAQVIGAGLVSVSSYFIYTLYIFKPVL